MAYNYTECNRDQLYLLPPSMKAWLGEDHFAWFLLDAMDQMDLSAFHAAYRSDGKGQQAHPPEIVLPVMLYGYCHGERSSRQLERLCEESVPYRILAADTRPDHCAFARFRQRHESALKAVFMEVLRLCAEAGVLKVGVVSLDGTKLKANAALSANRTLEGLEKEKEIAAMVSEASARDAEEDAQYGADRRGAGGCRLLQREEPDERFRRRAGASGKHDERLEPPPRGRIPKGLTATQRMERKLRTKRGAARYRKRAQTVEPVFGQVKDARGLDRFCRRGDTACDSEWAVMCATHNLLKLYRSGKAKWNSTRGRR
jgi:transposase